MRLAVGIPSNGEIKAETVSCVIQALFQTQLTGLGLIFPTGCLIHENRCAIAEEAVSQNFDYLLFIDSDMVFPAHAITTLIAQQKPVIGANYHKRGRLPPENVVKDLQGQLLTTLPIGPFKCGGLATGFMLIDVGVFKVIDYPWFFYQPLQGNQFLGEDYWFCDRVREKGLDVWCDPTINLRHIGDYKY